MVDEDDVLVRMVVAAVFDSVLEEEADKVVDVEGVVTLLVMVDVDGIVTLLVAVVVNAAVATVEDVNIYKLVVDEDDELVRILEEVVDVEGVVTLLLMVDVDDVVTLLVAVTPVVVNAAVDSVEVVNAYRLVVDEDDELVRILEEVVDVEGVVTLLLMVDVDGVMTLLVAMTPVVVNAAVDSVEVVNAYRLVVDEDDVLVRILEVVVDVEGVVTLLVMVDVDGVVTLLVAVTPVVVNAAVDSVEVVNAYRLVVDEDDVLVRILEVVVDVEGVVTLLVMVDVDGVVTLLVAVTPVVVNAAVATVEVVNAYRLVVDEDDVLVRIVVAAVFDSVLEEEADKVVDVEGAVTLLVMVDVDGIVTLLVAVVVNAAVATVEDVNIYRLVVDEDDELVRIFEVVVDVEGVVTLLLMVDVDGVMTLLVAMTPVVVNAAVDSVEVVNAYRLVVDEDDVLVRILEVVVDVEGVVTLLVMVDVDGVVTLLVAVTPVVVNAAVDSVEVVNAYRLVVDEDDELVRIVVAAVFEDVLEEEIAEVVDVEGVVTLLVMVDVDGVVTLLAVDVDCEGAEINLHGHPTYNPAARSNTNRSRRHECRPIIAKTTCSLCSDAAHPLKLQPTTKPSIGLNTFYKPIPRYNHVPFWCAKEPFVPWAIPVNKSTPPWTRILITPPPTPPPPPQRICIACTLQDL